MATSTCRGCGCEFPRAHNHQLFCTVDCREDSARRRRRRLSEERVLARAVRKCLYCDTTFVPRDTRKIFCNAKCLEMHRHLTERKIYPPRACLGCGVEFVPTDSRKTYCTDKCSWRTNDELCRLGDRWATRLFRSAIGHSISRGHAAPSITRDDLISLWSKQNGRCYWTDIPMEMRSRSPYTVSLERLNNSMGYEPGNIALVCWWANKARSNWPHDVFADIIEQLRATILQQRRVA